MVGADTYVPGRLWSNRRLPQVLRTGTGYVDLVFSVISSCRSCALARSWGVQRTGAVVSGRSSQ